MKTLRRLLAIMLLSMILASVTLAQTPAVGVTFPPPYNCSEYDCTVTYLFNEGGYMVADTTLGYVLWLIGNNVCYYYLWCS